jgi:CYTH domain-containing protein
MSQATKIETELKFRLTNSPDTVPEPSNIQQTYLDFSMENAKDCITTAFKEAGESDIVIDWDSITEARTREESTPDGKVVHTVTLKGSGTMQRKEIEVVVHEKVFTALTKAFCQDNSITKLRYRIPLGTSKLCAELDVYTFFLIDLIVLEVEFDPTEWSPEAVEALVIATFNNEKENIVNVTADSRYKNKNLSKLSSAKGL